MAKFEGFPDETLRFLAELTENNHRDWFNANKSRYEQCVRSPALDFITAMSPLLAQISPHFHAIPKKVGGSLMRVYRDTRFSKDKTPYKTNVGIQFRHEAGKDVHAPGYYLHIDNTGCFLGVGLWRPDADALAGIRQRIDAKQPEWKKATGSAAFRSKFALAGDSLKRPPRGYDAEHPWIEDLKRKDFIATTDIPATAISEPDFAKQVAQTYKKATLFMSFLCRAVEVDF